MLMTTNEIRAAIQRVPRVRFNHLPTPLQRARRLSTKLGIDLWIKRDDLAESFGGNKSRTLEFRLAEALQLNPDPLILVVEGISNTAPATAMVCNRLGIPLVMILRDQPETNLQGNLLLNYLYGIEIQRFQGGGMAASAPAADALAERYKSEGRNPVILNRVGSFFGYGPSLAYLEALVEIEEAAAPIGLDIDHIYICSTGKSQAGLIAGAKLLGRDYAIRGVTPYGGKGSVEGIVSSVSEVGERLGVAVSIAPSEVINDTSQIGPGYGTLTPEAIGAIRLVAEHEGILLDADRTGKTFAGLLKDVENGVIKPGETVVFMHTGGVASLFAHAGELLEAVQANW